MIQTDFLQTTKMNYGALPLDKNEVRVSNIGHAAGTRLGAVSHWRCKHFFYIIRL